MPATANVDFAAAYHLTQHIALRGGYLVLWLDNLQLGADAASTTRQIAGGTTSPPKIDGRLVYNGAAAGIEFTC